MKYHQNTGTQIQNRNSWEDTLHLTNNQKKESCKNCLFQKNSFCACNRRPKSLLLTASCTMLLTTHSGQHPNTSKQMY
jgi:hypothetical protein